MDMPKTPFSTRLSGSAKETELRLRSIFQWKKKRPPVIVLVLVVVLLLGICGGLIGFSSSPRNGTISELYPEYFAGNSVREVWYEDKEAYVPGALEFGSENFVAAMEYFGAMKLRAVTGQNKYIGEFDRRKGAFYLEGEQDVPLKVEFYPDGYVVISTGRGSTEDHKDAKVYRAEAFDKEVFLGYWETGDAQPQHPPTITVSMEDLFDTVQQIEENEDYPAQIYQVEVTGLSVPVMLTMKLDRVTAIEAHGHSVTLTEPLDIYGNRNFDLFEGDGAVILEGGYYWIGDVYVLSPGGCSEVHPGEEASYYLYRDDQGNLKYRLTNNKVADITQIGALSAVTRYGELLQAHGDASIVNGEPVFAEPERQEFADYERLQREFELGWWSEHYHSVEEILEMNRAGKEGREPSLIYSLSYRDDLICEYYSNGLRRVYMAGEESVQPQEGDLRIEEVTVLGEIRVNEVTGQLLEVRQSRHGSDGWQEYTGYLVITIGMDNAYDRVIGIPTVHEGQTVEEIILQAAYGLSDLEVSLSRDGYPGPIGPGTNISFHREVYDGPETVEVQEGWSPIYYEGDYWAIHRWNGVEALCYHRASDGGYSVNTFDTTRTDLYTRRGIRVGDSRVKVMETYPELKSGDYWGKYSGEDYLWYCRSEQDFGAALIFFFENDAVSRIVLNNMFN